MVVEKFPEQYPATVDEWADPVDSDNAEMAALRPLLKNTNLEFRGLQLTYSANRDGWNPVSFHKKVDKKGGGMSLFIVSHIEVNANVSHILFRCHQIQGSSFARLPMV
jgi:hypothetical protein